MKIIQVSTYFHPAVGGVERQVEEIAVHLQALGHEVTVLTTDANHGKVTRMQRLEESYRGLKIKRFPYRIKLGNFLRFAPGLAIALWQMDYDLVHVHNTHDGHLLPAILIKLLRGKKLVITGHNPYVVTSEKRGDSLHAGVKFYDWVFKLFSRWVDAYVALLPSEKEYVASHFHVSKDRIRVVPNGIQDQFYTAVGDAQKFFTEWQIDPTQWKLILGAACRLNYVKGLQNLLQAAQQNPDVLFIFAGGDDGYAGQLKRLFQNCANVLFTDEYVPTEKMPDFLQAIDLFLLPSVYEPFGMTIVEAMAQGKYILSSNVGGPNEILSPEIGELIAPEDQQAWADRIAYWKEHRGELVAKSAASKKVSEQYRWDKVIAALDKVYKLS